MRKALVAIVAGMLLGSMFTEPAIAAKGQVAQFRFHGDAAEAEWFSAEGNRFTDTYLNVSSTHSTQKLYLDRFSGRVSPGGILIGGTEISARVRQGFTFSIDTSRLLAATVRASALPATRCSIDGSGKAISCEPTKIRVVASWTGRGSISRETRHEHLKIDGFGFNDHFHGTFREARAAGVVAGHELTGKTLAYADLGVIKQGTTYLCIGGC